ncbi:two-component sensor histidine kinase [Conyzicola nivalis]|uniref:histidine kinase n=2 Tax=Conyzicola nivalis TaxID=1477021 RepID=A0A916WHK8_9MICO|nr:two-component sensor histidine kinase [Conyzicola nivalis]
MFDVSATPSGRFQVFLQAQLPLLAGALFVGIATAIVLPESYQSFILPAGLAVILFASVSMLVFPWEKIAPSWMILVAITDIVGVTFMRTELIQVIPSVGILVIFPILWLAYGFRPGVVFVALAGACFISTFPFIYRGAWPSNGVEWLNVITLPALAIGIALVVNLAALQLRRNAEKLAEASREQTVTLRRALDNEILSRNILDTVNAGVAFYSSDNELLLSNALARGMTRAVGFELDQPPYGGEQVLAADRKTAIAIEDQIIPRALRGELLEDHLEWLGPPDQQSAILASSRRVEREDGALLGTVVMAYDITELAAAISVREEFLGTVSHELRTPLTSVVGYLELIADDLDPTTNAEALVYLQIVRRNMNTLAERISYMAGSADTALTLRPADTDVVALVASCVQRASDKARSRGVTLDNTVTGPASAHIDAGRISQALDELIANAIKFSPSGSTVTVSQVTDDDSVRISVSDGGPGMTRSEQTRVFDRFYRTQHARDQAVQGFGLGLFVVKNIMTAHGGHVTIERSSPENGTRMTLTMPRRETERPVAPMLIPSNRTRS